MREAQLEDLDFWCDMVEAKTYPATPCALISGEMRQQLALAKYSLRWEDLLAHPEVGMLVSDDPAGFLLLECVDVDSVTGQRQATIRDWGGAIGTLLGPACARARQHQAEVLVTSVYHGEAHPFSELGFGPECARVLKPLKDGSSAVRLPVRPARIEDLDFILDLNALAPEVYTPAHRQVDPARVARRMADSYRQLRFKPGSGKLLGLIVGPEGQPCGYMLLGLGRRMEITRAVAAYVYDINIHPQQRGTGAFRDLLKEAQSQLLERGCEYLAGDISWQNQRALRVALGAGFTLDWVRWGLPLGGG